MSTRKCRDDELQASIITNEDDDVDGPALPLSDDAYGWPLSDAAKFNRWRGSDMTRHAGVMRRLAVVQPNAASHNNCSLSFCLLSHATPSLSSSLAHDFIILFLCA
ncbi:hypothetical protein M758_5G191500 [Ceratodon purpureus]|uniref:Uncharacterized protein n=1 Tax=Ceratodon purpureus TaxID=3225 RepID=A0A8T0I3H3_CERPU|nr:hypothetical protein KC19_5G198700 [Ceratodon purpureus]KAG0617472.1 hypothetical protein M758_5G191500 [Ceratodon purpureus]